MLKLKFRSAMLATYVVAIIVGTIPAAFADTVLRYSPWLPDGYPLNGEVLKPFMAKVEKVTEGRVRFEWLPKTVGTPPAQFDVVRDGATDMSVIVPGYTPGRFKAAELGELPLLSSDIEILATAFQDIYSERLAGLRMFEGTHVLSIWSTITSHVASRKSLIRT